MSGRAAGLTGVRTNLFRRGQCDTTTDTGTLQAGTTPSVDATVAAPLSPQSIKVTCDGTAANQGIQQLSATGQAAAAGTMGAVSVYFKGVAGAPYFVNTRWINTDATSTDGQIAGFTATGAWQLLTPASVAVAAGKAGDRLSVRLIINGTRAESFGVAHAMLEKGQSVVSLYIPTKGGNTSSRSVGRRWATDTCRRPMRRFAQVWP